MPLIHSIRVYSGRVLDLDLDEVRFPNDSTGTLEMIRHPGAAAVIPHLDPLNSDDPRVVLIHQFRHAADQYLWEIPAGRLEPSEEPEACARREMEEETGLVAGIVEPITTIYTTPGFTDEVIHLFSATVVGEVEHDREPDEFLEVKTLRWSEVMGMLEAGVIRDGKTICCLLHLERFHRTRARD